MAETSQYVDEAVDALHMLELGRANAVSPYLFQQALEELGPGHPQICGPLKRCLVHPDDMNVRLKVLQMVGHTGHGWVQIYGPQFADEVVLSIADSNLLCAANACHAIQYWDTEEPVSTALLHWAKRKLPGVWEVAGVDPTDLPSIKVMLQELPSYQGRIEDRRDLPNSNPSLENNIRLFGKLKGTLMSMFNRG